MVVPGALEGILQRMHNVIDNLYRECINYTLIPEQQRPSEKNVKLTVGEMPIKHYNIEYEDFSYYDIRASLAICCMSFYDSGKSSEPNDILTDVNKLFTLMELSNLLILNGAGVWMPTLNGNEPRKRRCRMCKPIKIVVDELYEYITIRSGYKCDSLRAIIYGTRKKNVGFQDVHELYNLCVNAINLDSNIPDKSKIVATWAALEYLNLSLGHIQLY